MGPVSSDSAPPVEPPVSDAGAEAAAAEPPMSSSQSLPFTDTCTCSGLNLLPLHNFKLSQPFTSKEYWYTLLHLLMCL